MVSFPCLWPGPDRRAVPGPVPVAGARRPPPGRRPGAGAVVRVDVNVPTGGRARLALPVAVAAAKARRGWALRTEPARRQQPPKCMPTRRSGVGTFNGLKRAAALSVRPSADGHPA